MMTNFTNEQLEAARAAKLPGEHSETQAVELSEEELRDVAGGGDNPLLADLVDLNTACLYGLMNGNTIRTCGSPDSENGTPHCRYLDKLEMNPSLTMLLCAWRARNK